MRGEGHLHEVPGKVTGRVAHTLVNRRDVAARGVVVSSEVGAGEPALGGVFERGKHQAPVGADQRLGQLDHELELQRPRRQPQRALEGLEGGDGSAHLLGAFDLRHCHHEARWQAPLGVLHQGGEEDVERANRPGFRDTGERLDADADEGRERALLEAAGQLPGRPGRVAVLLGVGADAVAVLEVEPVVLHRLMFELGPDASEDGVGEPGLGLARLHLERLGLEPRLELLASLVRLGERSRSGKLEGPSEGYEVGGVLLEGSPGQRPHLPRGVEGEQMRPAVHHVHRLPAGGHHWESSAQCRLARREWAQERIDPHARQRRLHRLIGHGLSSKARDSWVSAADRSRAVVGSRCGGPSLPPSR